MIKIKFIYLLTLLAFYAANIYQCPAHKYFQYFKWLMLSILLVCLFFRNYKEIRFSKWNWIIWFFLIFSFASIFISISTKESFIKATTFIFLFIISYELKNFFLMYDFKQVFFPYLLYLSVIIVTFTTVLYFLGINHGRNPFGRFSMWVDNPNTLGSMIFPLVPISVYYLYKYPSFIKKTLISFLVIFQFFILYLTASRASTLAAIIAVACLILSISKLFSKVKYLIYTYIFLFLLTIVTCLYCLPKSTIDTFIPIHRATLERSSNINKTSYSVLLLSGRGSAWKAGYDELEKRPLLGTGAGTEKKVLKINKKKLIAHAGEYMHNSFVASFVEYGLLGGGLIIIIILFPIYYLVRIFFCSNNNYNIEFITLLAIYLSCLVNAFFESWLLSIGNLNILIFWPVLLILLDAKKYKSEFTIKTNT